MNRRRWVPALVAIVLGLLLTPLAAVFALGSAGGGHGSSVPALVLFPFAMLLGFLDAASPIVRLVALIQFPLYGVLSALLSLRAASPWRAIARIGMVHVVAVLAALLAGAVTGRVV